MLSTEMSWEVVQDFLNVSGIKGVALIDGQSRPYFKGIEKVLNSQQREALAQGVWQVLETIPENFDSFEFQFAGTQVYIHKMTRGLILLVLTHDSLLYPDYCEAFTRLKASFEADDVGTLESFRRLLGSRNTAQALPIDEEDEPVALANGAVDDASVMSEPVTSAPVTDISGINAATGARPTDTAIEQEIAASLAEQNGQGGAAFTTAASTEPSAHSAQVRSAPVHPEPAEETLTLEDTFQDLFDEENEPINPFEAEPAPDPRSTPESVVQPAVTPKPDSLPIASMPAPPEPMFEPAFKDEPAVAGSEDQAGSVALPSVEPTLVATPLMDALLESELQSGRPSAADSRTAPSSASASSLAPAAGISLQEWVDALNCLGQCAVHYLGRAVVANYWRTSRPDSAWSSTFEIERSAEIKPSPALPLGQPATAQQRGEMQDWAEKFSERCGRVIRDFPQLAETQGLKAEQRQLLGL